MTTNRFDACLDSIDEALRESLEVQIHAMAQLPPEYGANAGELLALAREKKAGS